MQHLITTLSIQTEWQVIHNFHGWHSPYTHCLCIFRCSSLGHGPKHLECL